MRRVVITGVGAVTPVGLDAASTWAALLEGQSGVGLVTLFDAREFPVKIAGEVKGFDASGRIEPKELRRIQKLVTQHQGEFLEAWHGHLGAGG